MTLSHFPDIGSDGRIVRWSASAAASQHVSVMHWTSYQRRWTRHMSVPCEGLIGRTGNSHIACFSSSQWLPDHFTSRNWPTCSRSNSMQYQYQHFTRIGAWKIQWMPYCLHVPLYSPLSTTKAPPSSNSHISRSRNS